MNEEENILVENFNNLNKFFIKKILERDFILFKKDKFKASIAIQVGEKEFCFTFWIATGFGDFGCYEEYENTIFLEFSREEKQIAYKIIESSTVIT